MLAGFAGEEDEARLVGFEPGDVEGECFFVGGLAAGVDGNADCAGEFAGDAGFLDRLLAMHAHSIRQRKPEVLLLQGILY